MAVDDIVHGFEFVSKHSKRSIWSLPPPFDRGEKLLRSNPLILFGIALPPFLIELGMSYMRYYSPTSLRQEFLFSVAVLLITSWITMTVAVVSVEWLRGKEIKLLSASARALQSLPKVVLSYISLLILIVYAAFYLPFVGFLCVFLIWAPIFCAGEIFSTENIAAAKAAAKKKRLKDDDDEDGGFFGFGSDVDDDRDDLGRNIKKIMPIKWFAMRPIWDLGFARALNFSSKNPLITLQVVVLFWAASMFPGAMVVTLSGVHMPFAAEVVRVAFSEICRVFVLTLGTVAFFSLQPAEGAKELEIPAEEIQPKLVKMIRKKGVVRSLLPFAICAALGGWGTITTIEWYIAQREMPAETRVALKKVEANPQQLVLSVRFEDPKYLFRWLDPDGFLVRVQPTGGVSAETKAQVLEPERVMPYDDSGSSLPEGDFTPLYRPLVLSIHIPYSAKTQETGEVELFYSPPGFSQLAVESTAPKGDPIKMVPGKETGNAELIIPPQLNPILKTNYQRAD